MIVIAITRRYCHLLFFLLLLLSFLSINSAPALADGGAPQLAYVAGTPQGISIIDIAQRRVTRTLVESGWVRIICLATSAWTSCGHRSKNGEDSLLSYYSWPTVAISSKPGFNCFICSRSWRHESSRT